MTGVSVDRFNLNDFYNHTPTGLKYILVISLIIVGSYFLFSRKISKGQDEQLDKIEQTIETTYTIIDNFDKFKDQQFKYNEQMLNYLHNIYTLVEELNENTNKKFDMLLQAGGQNTNQILEKLTLLNESFEKLQKAYTPNEFQEEKKPMKRISGVEKIIPKNGPKIKVVPIKKKKPVLPDEDENL